MSYIPYGHHGMAEAEGKIRAAMTVGVEVYFVDVAPTRKFLDELMTAETSGLPVPRSIQVMDHHKSAADELAGYTPPACGTTPVLDIFIDEHYSSASNMIWRRMLPDREAPYFLTLIDKMDLAHDLSNHEELSAAATIDSRDISNVEAAFSSFAELADIPMHDMVTGGKNILIDQKNRIGKLNDNIMYTRFQMMAEEAEILWVPILNADVQNFGRHISDYLRGHGTKTGGAIAFAWYMQGNGSITMSIRSNGELDASKVAEALCVMLDIKGGGHKTSAAVHFTSLRQFSENIELYSYEQMTEVRGK